MFLLSVFSIYKCLNWLETKLCSPDKMTDPELKGVCHNFPDVVNKILCDLIKSQKHFFLPLRLGVPDNPISLYFSVTNNTISLHFGVPDNQISLHTQNRNEI